MRALLLGKRRNSEALGDRSPVENLCYSGGSDHCRSHGREMDIEGLDNLELMTRIASLWLRNRGDPTLAARIPHALREALDEAVRRATVARAARAANTSDTPTETPASRRKQSVPPHS